MQTVISRNELRICSRCGDLIHIPIGETQECPKCGELSELQRVSIDIVKRPEKRQNLSALPTINQTKVKNQIRKDNSAVRLNDMNNNSIANRLL